MNKVRVRSGSLRPTPLTNGSRAYRHSNQYRCLPALRSRRVENARETEIAPAKGGDREKARESEIEKDRE